MLEAISVDKLRELDLSLNMNIDNSSIDKICEAMKARECHRVRGIFRTYIYSKFNLDPRNICTWNWN